MVNNYNKDLIVELDASPKPASLFNHVLSAKLLLIQTIVTLTTIFGSTALTLFTTIFFRRIPFSFDDFITF